MAEEKLLIEIKEDAAFLTINRPQVHNAIDNEVAIKIRETVKSFDSKSIRAIFIRGAGGKAFCAGTDLKERSTLDAEGKWNQARLLYEAGKALENAPQVVVAVLEGYVLGGGLTVAISSDLRIASSNAVFGFPEMTLGAFPGGGTVSRLPQVITPSAAKWILMGQDRISAQEAYHLGLVHKVAGEDELDNVINDIRSHVSRCSVEGISSVKMMLNNAAHVSREQAQFIEDILRKPFEGNSSYAAKIKDFVK